MFFMMEHNSRYFSVEFDLALWPVIEVAVKAFSIWSKLPPEEARNRICRLIDSRIEGGGGKRQLQVLFRSGIDIFLNSKTTTCVILILRIGESGHWEVEKVEPIRP